MKIGKMDDRNAQETDDVCTRNAKPLTEIKLSSSSLQLSEISHTSLSVNTEMRLERL